MNFHIGPCSCLLESRAVLRCLVVASQTIQAFDVAVQTPDIVRVLHRPAETAVQAKVGSVDGRGIRDMALFQ